MKDLSRRLGRWLTARPRRARLATIALGAAATAALLALYSRVETPWFALGFVALVPWLLAQDRAVSWGEAAAAGTAMSAAFVVAVFPWLPEAAQRYSAAPSLLLWLLLIVLSPVIEPQFLVFALVRHLVRRAPLRRAALEVALAAACAYVSTELLVPKLLFDTLGQGLYPSLSLRQAADIAGVHGLTFLLLLINEAFLVALRSWTGATAEVAKASGPPRSRARALLPALGCALGLIILQAAYGYVRVAQVRAHTQAPGLLVGVVQANITNYDKLRAEKGTFEAVRMILDTHYALTDELLGRARADLIVWPETVYPTTFGSPRSEAGAALDDEIRAFAASRGAPLVFGAYDLEKEREFNAAFFLSASPDGHPSSRAYRKTMLFPFTEHVPEVLDSEALRQLLPWTGHWESGPGPRVIDIKLRDGKSVSAVPLICYDVLFPGFVADAARMGADLIVTLSNDSWFPDERAPRLHLFSAAFRSVETRLPQVRATNSGISAVIAPTGEITATTRWDGREILVANLPGAGRMMTPAVAWGRWLGPALLSAALVFSVHAGVRRRHAPRAPENPVILARGAQRKRRKRTTAGTRPK